MKTISMPLEEYENDIKAARASGYKDGFQKGVMESVYQIEERLYRMGREPRGMIDSGLAKVIKDCVARIRKKFTTVEISQIRSDV